MSTPAIDQMSWEEKLRALEELWDVITREGDRYESPAWHEQELKGTPQHCNLGAEVRSKRKLREKFGGRGLWHPTVVHLLQAFVSDRFVAMKDAWGAVIWPNETDRHMLAQGPIPYYTKNSKD